MGYVIGVDVGSQSVKALLMDEDGTSVATANASCEMQHPAAGWAEQHPRDWERALAQTVREVRVRASVGREEVEMVGLACQVDGLVALDADREPVRPAIIWLDRRASRQAATLRDAVGEAELVSETGLVPDASHTAPKAMWLRDEEPALYAKSRWLASVGAHLNGWLTGEVAQDHANASSTLLYGLCARAWSSRLVEHAGLDAERLPPIRSAVEVLGPLRGDSAETLGLSTRCQIIVGTGDDHAATLGAGALEPGVVVDITGTAEPVAVLSTDVVIDEERLVETHAHAVEGMLLVENPGFVSGGSTKWLASTYGIGQDELFARAGEVSPGAGDVLFLPALSGAMAPRWNDQMRGAFAGLAMNHDFAHMARAVLEGCAYAFRDIIDRLAALGLVGDEIRAVGGGARSPLWLQIKADVTGRRIQPVRGTHTTAAGAAMLAGVAAGFFRDLHEAAAQCVRPEKPIVPQPAVAERYQAGYLAYRRLFDAVELALA